MTAIDPTSSTASDDRSNRFDVVLLPHGDYRDTQRYPGFDADTEASAIAELLNQLGGEGHVWEPRGGLRDLSATVHRLQEWSGRASGRSSVLVWIGHGPSNADSASLIVSGAQGEREDLDLQPAIVAWHIRREYARRRDRRDWVIVVVEACSAAAFVSEVGLELRKTRGLEGILLLASGGDQGSGYLARFRRALAEWIDELQPTDTVIRLADLHTRFEESLVPGLVDKFTLARSHPIVRPTRLPGLQTSVEAFAELTRIVEGLPAQQRITFARMGSNADLGEVAWHFVGRDHERAEIATWLAGSNHGVLAVTGPRGVGKSAVLGNLLLHSRPELAGVLAEAGFSSGRWPRSGRPPTIDASVHLAGMTVAEVISSLVDALGISAPGAVPEQPRHDIVSALGEVGQAAGFTVLADALDEAAEPMGVAALLNEIGSLCGVRVVVGVRTPESRPQHSAGDPTLLRQLGLGHPHVRDLVITSSNELIAEYLERRMAGAGVAGAAVGKVLGLARSVQVGHTAGLRTFLDANLAAHAILSDREILSEERTDELVELLSSDYERLFRSTVDQLTDRIPKARYALEALAVAQGRGLPMAGQIWAASATALYGEKVTGADISAARSAAAPYILLDVEDGQSVYRLANQALREALQASAVSTAPAENVAKALLTVATQTGSDLNPYLVRHLPAHLAALGGKGWDLVVEHLDVLDRLDARAVAFYAMRDGDTSALPPAVTGTIATAHLAVDTDSNRAGLRELGSARTTGVPPAAHYTEDQVWGVRWAHLARHSLHLTLNAHPGQVRTLAAFPSGSGTLLATGSSDGLVRVWDPLTGNLAAQAPVPHAGAITALAACGTPAGGVVASLGADMVVHVWNYATRQPMCAPFPVKENISALCLIAEDDQPILLASGGWNGRIRLWRLDSSTPTSARPPNHDGAAVSALHTWVDPTGVLQLVSAGADHVVNIWRHDGTDAPLRWRCPIPFSTVAVFSDRDGRLRIATAGKDSTVRLWDKDSRQIGQPLSAPLVRVLTVLRYSDRSLLAAAGADGVIRLWDTSTGATVDAPLTGHAGEITSIVAISHSDGRVELATGGLDRTVRVWDPVGNGQHDRPVITASGSHPTMLAAVASSSGTVLVTGVAAGITLFDATSGEKLSRRRPMLDEPICALHASSALGTKLVIGTESALWLSDLADARISCLASTESMCATASFDNGGGVTVVVVVCEDDGVAHLWDASTGREARPSFAAHNGRVRTVAAGYDQAGRAILAVGGDDHTVAVWDPWTPKAIAPRLTGFGYPVRNLAFLTGRDGTKLLAAADRECVLTWNTETWQRSGSALNGLQEWIVALAVLPSGGGDLLVAGTDDGMVCVWDPIAPEPKHYIPLGSPVLSMVVLGNDLAVATSDGTVALRWNPAWLNKENP
ncbi:NACHT and WD repeat domain-containing protein [Nocardia sp. NPDC058379]|uniref:NACHT and WD repeat domain-containing protein n=1 Tax=unclassified Nocardia TaxID=2637762 RepID=UPI0036625564